jgi:hypothetical protein
LVVMTASPPTARIDVEFLADGRCTVSAAGETFHSTLTYTPPAAIVQTDELRCGIPPVPEGTIVDLSVSLPEHVSPSPGRDAPRLAWAERGSRWVGTATLTTAPVVVRIMEAGSPRMHRARVMRFTVAAACAAAVLAGAMVVRRRRR